MKIVKNAGKWILPILLVGGLLITMSNFKHTNTLTPEETEKITQYTDMKSE